MERLFPALEIRFETSPGADRLDHLLAVLDDASPTAVDERASGVAVFFSSPEQRDRALDLARSFAPEASITSVSISDEAWAERSQASLGAIRVGRIVVTPPWGHADAASSGEDIVITIVPSMGFGTGHHASTRLCLRLLQPWSAHARSALDIGTGSGVLAIAAWRLGAEHALGIDIDADAVTSARENVELNGADSAVELQVADLAHVASTYAHGFDAVVANLTGAMLERFAAELGSLVALGGSLIVSGFQTDEENRVSRALEAAGFCPAERVEEEHWVAIRMTARTFSP